MGLRILIQSVLLVSPILQCQALPERSAQDGIVFNRTVARQNGPRVFNAVHDAMRQWGSSLHHNGMSFFLATVPEGVLLHHGNGMQESPTWPDWLAFEIEHAENFAGGGRGRRPGGPPGESPEDPPPPPSYEPDGQQSVLAQSDALSDDPRSRAAGGWLHVYQSTRELRYIYVDGMSGGKTSMGTMDTQDYLLRGIRNGGDDRNPPGRPGGPMGEQERANELCELCKTWQLDGIIRMEAGFEIIQCNFSEGLKQIQALQRPSPVDLPTNYRSISGFEFVRALSERYQGIGASRATLDFSSMVSAFFFPLNLSNPNPARPDLPRLSMTTDDELAAIKTKLTEVIELRRGLPHPVAGVNWQGVSDLIVGRYADRLQYMEKMDSAEDMSSELRFILTAFIDYSSDELDIPTAIDRCAHFYLRSAVVPSESDHIIYAAFEVVTTEICTRLFEARNALAGDNTTASLSSATEILRSLMDWLDWTRFKHCPACSVNEVCVIPMWPLGREEDYHHPRCANMSNFDIGGKSYWDHDRPRRPPGDSDDREPPMAA
ncbi:hypothetical protein GQ53DRAFT_755035 [Thozetella sp. PMI_491]|nr:hypothetical protein GQ53DRAFT_755035 [Thozetella sp. PMI_491]